MEIKVKFGDKVYTASQEDWRKMIDFQEDLRKNYKLPKVLEDFYRWYYAREDEENI